MRGTHTYILHAYIYIHVVTLFFHLKMCSVNFGRPSASIRHNGRWVPYLLEVRVSFTFHPSIYHIWVHVWVIIVRFRPNIDHAVKPLDTTHTHGKVMCSIILVSHCISGLSNSTSLLVNSFSTTVLLHSICCYHP